MQMWLKLTAGAISLWTEILTEKKFDHSKKTNQTALRQITELTYFSKTAIYEVPDDNYDAYSFEKIFNYLWHISLNVYSM